jgi:Cu(I)/Ag(I) efflux system membrane protein CusA/SilA
VAGAQRAVTEAVKFPPGYFITWSGQFEYLERAKAKLAVVVPVTLLIIFLLLYLNFGRLTETLVVMLSLPFSLVGGLWLMWWMGFNFSVAVAVGFIALAGVADEIQRLPPGAALERAMLDYARLRDQARACATSQIRP